VFVNGGASTGCGGTLAAETPPTTGGSTPPPPAVAHVGSISGGHVKVTVKLSCPAGGAACAKVSLKATVKEHLKGHKITAVTASGKPKKTHTKQVVVASGSATLSAGAARTFTLTLNATGRALLARFGKLTVLVTISSGDKTIHTVTVTVHKAAKAKKKKK
jgi:VCBS repeat-containing protein